MGFLAQFFPTKPSFTEANLSDLSGKVYLVTGSNRGIGKDLVQLLYSKNARVYMAARSKATADEAIRYIKSAHPQSTGSIAFLRLDLADLSSIKTSVNEFLAQENELHVLFNNAGIMVPPEGSKSVQGYELQIAVNNLGHFLFTKLLTPVLQKTAASAPSNTVRTVWVSSSAMGNFSPTGGIQLDNLDYHSPRSKLVKYSVSKAGDYLYAAEFARRFEKDSVVSVAVDPGYLKTDLYQNMSMVEMLPMMLILKPQINGSYALLFSGLSPEVTLESAKKVSNWVAPFGKLALARPDIVKSTKLETEGGTGLGKNWWEWSEEQVRPYL